MKKAKEPTASAGIVERLCAHPDHRVIDFAGDRWHFLFGAYGMRKARAEGLAPLSSIISLATQAQAAAKRSKKDVEDAGRDLLANMKIDDLLLTYGEVIWTGLVPFYPSLTLGDVDAMYGPADMAALQDVVVNIMGAAAREEIAPDAEDGDDEADGKGKN